MGVTRDFSPQVVSLYSVSSDSILVGVEENASLKVNNM